MIRIDWKLLAAQLAHASREAWRIAAERRGASEHLEMLRLAQWLGRAAQQLAAEEGR
ncbi:hypothetical protein [Rhizorhabdus histidinilytica]|uniref:hypothetical protein n=1 Tax=Rhizorhabdus histidinilytica TaxID=439228 RepID=UPI00321FD595